MTASVRTQSPAIWSFIQVVAMVVLTGAAGTGLVSAHAAGELEHLQVGTTGSRSSLTYEGVVEAVKQTVLAAQVAGAIVQLEVKAGDPVRAGQLLARVDARAAEQGMAASQAQAQSARVATELATKDLERQRQLFEKGFISRAAFDRAETEYRGATAQSAAQMALAGAAKTQSGFYLIRAPYAGIISELHVTLGDMAMPGKPVLTLFDPARLRVTIPVPQSLVATLNAADEIRIVVSEGLPKKQLLTPTTLQVLPSIDPGTHTAQVRLGLAEGTAGLVPGQFVRALLPGTGATSIRITVPLRSLVRRAEMTGLYVIDAKGRPVLRQVRLGPTQGEMVEVLAGLSGGERIALDPQAAARLR